MGRMAPGPARAMIVYMLLNTVTERCYVGQTTATLVDRVRGHWDSARTGTSTLNEAMRLWDDPCYWEFVVLQHCYDQKQLDQAEAAWQQICCAHDPAVGYNARREKMSRVRPDKPGSARADSNPLTTGGTNPKSPLYGLTPEERREYFREAGRRGAAKSKQLSKVSSCCK